MHDLALVRRPELAGQVARERPSSRGSSPREVHQPAGDTEPSGPAQVDRVAGRERALDAGDAGRQQRGAALGDRRDRARRRARSRPRAVGGVRQPQQLRVARRRRCGRNRCRRARRPARRRPSRGRVSTTGMPAPVAIRAASTLVPCRRCRPRRRRCRRSARRRGRSVVATSGDQPRARRATGGPSYRPSTSVSSTSRSACDQVGDQRGQPVVVAEADLGGRHRVVLVDDRQDAELEQLAPGSGGRCGSGCAGSRRRR